MIKDEGATHVTSLAITMRAKGDWSDQITDFVYHMDEARRVPADSIEWHRLDASTPRMYRSAVLLEPDPDGGYTVTIPALPGVVSEGDTIEEALDNIREALTAAIESYHELDMPIPWQEERRIEGLVKWIVVNA